MNFTKQLILALAAVSIIFVFFRIPVYNKLLHNRLGEFSDNFSEDLDHLDPKDRMLKRWREPYELSIFLKQRMETIHADTNAVLLVPPQTAFEKNIGAPLPEPIVVYYYSGLRVIYPENKGVEQAKYALLLKDGAMAIVGIDSPAVLKYVLRLYKTYKQ